MATLVITNPGSDDVHLGDFNFTLAAGASLTRVVSHPEYARMSRLHALIAATTLTAVYTPSAEEEAAGVLTPPLAVEPDDIARVAASALWGVPITLRKAFAAGLTAGADDVTILAANALPWKFRVLSVIAHISAAGAGGSTAVLRTRAGGSGTALATASTAATGSALAAMQGNATTVVTPAALDGLFLRRSDDEAAGEVIVTIRRES